MKIKWGKGIFSDELSGANRIKITDAIGRTIICEDGIPRRVVEIVPSNRWPWKNIINEKDPDSNAGYFVSTLSLTAQILGEPLPSREAEEAFKRMMQVKFKIGEDGKFDRPPEQPKSKLWLPAGFNKQPN